MEANDDWYQRMKRDIDEYREKFGEQIYREYRLDLLTRIARRVADFSVSCRKCRKLYITINNKVVDIDEIAESNKQEKLQHHKTIDEIAEHLQYDHHLMTDKVYARIGLAFGGFIGLSIGGASGQALDNLLLGIPIGVLLGLIVGALIGRGMDRSNERSGRIV